MVEASVERLQKILARAGFGSRRQCESIIEQGRVTVDGQVARLGQQVDPSSQEILVDGVPVLSLPGMVYYLLNKPRGVVCTARDPEGRKSVLELVPSEPRVFSVGRLDMDTEGLLILTNDGMLAQLLTHPRNQVPKEYLVQTRAGVTKREIARLKAGVELEDGLCVPTRVAQLGKNLLRITLTEGRNREVRRLFGALGLGVERLARTRIGKLSDPGLPPGEWRSLTPEEVRSLSMLGPR